MPELLRCYGCDELLVEEAFALDRGRPRGRQRRCRPCHAEAVRRSQARPRACVECGQPTPSRRARFCDPCRTEQFRGLSADRYLDHHGEARWTQPGEIADAIRDYVRRHGRLPTSMGWRLPEPGAEAVEGFVLPRRRYPRSETVVRVFGSWNAAIRAAGFVPRTRRDNGWSALTACPQGHPYDEENTYRRAGGRGRECRACHRERERDRYRRRRREEARARA